MSRQPPARGHGTVGANVRIAADLSCDGREKWKYAQIDAGIVDLVVALQKAGIDMRASCEGHDGACGRIDLEDGRIAFVVWPGDRLPHEGAAEDPTLDWFGSGRTAYGWYVFGGVGATLWEQLYPIERDNWARVERGVNQYAAGLIITLQSERDDARRELDVARAKLMSREDERAAGSQDGAAAERAATIRMLKNLHPQFVSAGDHDGAAVIDGILTNVEQGLHRMEM